MTETPSCWGRDRLLLANQAQNLLVVLRSNSQLRRTARVPGASADAHPLLRGLRELQRALMRPFDARRLGEERLLRPFCAVCVSGEAGAMANGVALTALASLVDLRAACVTARGMEKMLRAAYAARGADEDTDAAHELVLARRLQLCVSCAASPAARGMAERHFVEMITRAFAVAAHPDASPLLQRTAEKAMGDIVTALFRHVVAEEGVSELTGVHTLRYISALISGANDERHDHTYTDHSHTPSPTQNYTYSNHFQHNSNNHTSKDKSGSNVVRSARAQLEGLWLAQAVLFALQERCDVLSWGEGLLHSIQHDLCRALLVAGVSTDNDIVLSQLLRTVHLVIKVASNHVVPQVFSFVKALHVDPIMRITEDLRATNGRPAASPIMTMHSVASPIQPKRSSAQLMELYERREVLLESLAELCSDGNFATFCYAHYDLSRRFMLLLDRVCEVLVENCVSPFDVGDTTGDGRRVDRGSSLGNSAGSGNGGGNSNTGTTTGLNITSGSGGSSGGGSSNSGGVGLLGFGASEGVLSQTEALALDAVLGLLRQTSTSVVQKEGYHDSTLAAAVTARVKAQLQEKGTLMKFASLFRKDAAKEGIPFLLRTAKRVPAGSLTRDCDALVIEEPFGGREVGACLFRLNDVLDKRALGDYLGELGREPPAPEKDDKTAYAAWETERASDYLRPGSVRFYEAQLKGFLGEFDYKNKSLLSCIRETAYRMCMPGEAQKIDRVMEAFASRWMEVNRDASKDINPFCSEQGPFIIAFSLIMLNTDQHSGKMTRPMTQDDFRRINRDSDGGNCLSEEYLNHLFDDVKAHPIIMAEMINAGFSNDVTWALEMHEPSSFSLFSSPSTLCLLPSPTGTKGVPPITTVSMSTIPEEDSTASMIAYALHPFIFSAIWQHTLRAIANTLDGCRFVLERHSTPSLPSSRNGDDDRPILSKVIHNDGQKKEIEKEVKTIEEIPEEFEAPPCTAAEAYAASLDGLHLLAVDAAHLGISSAVDHVMLELIEQLPINLHDTQASLLLLGNHGFRRRALRTLMQVLKDCLPSLCDAWTEIAVFFNRLLLLGLLVPSDVGATNLWPELVEDPGAIRGVHQIMGGDAEDSGSGGSNGGGGGWLAAFWGSTAPSANDLLSAREEAQSAAARVKRIVTPIDEFLRLTDTIDGEARVQLLRGFCEAATVRSRRAVDGFAASYAMILVSALMVRHPTSAASIDRYVALCAHSLGALATLLDGAEGQGTHKAKAHNPNHDASPTTGVGSPRSRPSSGRAMSEEARVFWCDVTARFVTSAMRVVGCWSSDARTTGDSARLLTTLCEAPSSRCFAHAVAAPLAASLLSLVDDARGALDGGLWRAVLAAACRSNAHGAVVAMAASGRYDGPPLVDALVALSVGADGGVSEALAAVCRRAAAAGGRAAWTAGLRGLAALVLRGGGVGGALLALQRALLEHDAAALQAPDVAALYAEVIFPLVEEACVGAIPSARAADLRCRVVGLFPKAFLHHARRLAAAPSTLQELWHRILGTLYALYTAGDGESGDEDAAVLREAIQEAVKNTVHVLGAILEEEECKAMMRDAPFFWTTTRNMLRPFDFAEPLLQYIDALDAQ